MTQGRGWGSRASNIVLGLLLLLIVFELVAFVFVGRISRDEGWYLYAGHLVYEGDIPYRDFAYFQMPLLPYVFGLPQTLFGQSILVGRFTALACSAGALAISLVLVVRFGGRLSAIVLLAMTALTPHVLLAYTQARAEAASTLVAVAALACLVAPPRHTTLRLVAAPLMLLAGVSLRLSFLPAFVLATAFVWLTTRASWQARAQAAVIVAVPALLLVVLPLVASGDRYWFNVWTAQADRVNQGTSEPGTGDRLAFLLFWLSFALERMPLATLSTAFIAGWLAVRWRDGWRPQFADGSPRLEEIELLTLVLALALFAPFLSLNLIEPRYIVPSFAVLLIGVAIGASGAGEQAAAAAWPTMGATLVALLVLLLPLSGFYYSEVIDVRDPDIDGLEQGARVIREHVGPDETFIALDTTLAVASGRELARGYTMAQFSLWPVMDDDLAERRHLLNTSNALMVDADDPAAAIALTFRDRLYFAAAGVSTFPAQGLLTLADEQSALHCYDLVETVPKWGEANEDLYVYARTETARCLIRDSGGGTTTRAYLGETLTAGELQVTVLGADIDSDAIGPPPAGVVWIVIDARVENVGTGTIVVSDFLQTSLEDFEGNRYAPALDQPLPQTLNADLPVGETLEGSVAFAVPPDATGLQFLFQAVGEIEPRRWLLEEPP